jgi:hypothetical protein
MRIKPIKDNEITHKINGQTYFKNWNAMIYHNKHGNNY